MHAREPLGVAAREPAVPGDRAILLVLTALEHRGTGERLPGEILDFA